MNSYNYNYSSPNNSSLSYSQYASTPSNTRFQRPRFGYAGPPSYPRPRSSASKPNPDNITTDFDNKFRTFPEPVRDYSHGYTDSMINNYGDSSLNESSTFNNTRSTYGDSQLSSSTDYYTTNDTFYSSPQKALLPDQKNEPTFGLTTKPVFPTFGGENRQVSSFFYTNTGGPTPGFNTNLGGDYENASRGLSTGLNTNFGGLTASFTTGTRGNSFGNKRGTRGRSQKNNPRGGGRGGKMQSNMQATIQSTEKYGSRWNCSVCSIVFTSQIPLEMHLRGARHAKKLKSQNALFSIQDQVSQVKEIEKPDGKKYICELCNVVANSSLQLQMHLVGTKHKNKLNPPPKEGESKPDKPQEVNGKSNGGVVRSAPSDLEGPKPNKMMKYGCDICSVVMNSDVQLQQHLTSKKHQAKVEGKPIVKKNKKKEGEAGQPAKPVDGVMAADKPELTNVVGVKTLSASFVAGETLH